MRKSSFLFTLVLLLGLYGCSNTNDKASTGVHLTGWYGVHRAAAASKAPTFSDCRGCHGVALAGSASIPGCFAATFNNQGCHPSGPGTTPHPVNGSYLLGTNHGPDAKADLTACQQCHGESGGAGTNPRFNRGISSAGGTGCEGCHGLNYAHPADWAGPNSTFHYSAGNIQNACKLCHGSSLDGVGGVGMNCLNCHADVMTFTLNCNACHGMPPNGSADLDVPAPVPHGNVAIIAKHDECLFCHGVKPSTGGGTLAASADYKLFNKAANILGDHWNGQINMSSSVQYNENNFGCDNAGCHGNNAAHRLSDSGLPVKFGDYGSGPALLHPVDGTFLLPANHGPAAKGLTAAYPDGIADCQPCHATEGQNPRFNVGISAAGGKGCEGCHNDFTAHPSQGGRESVDWYDLSPTHSNVPPAKYAVMCSPCHGSNLDGIGGVGGAGGCTNCHVADPVTNPNCVSCHSLPPNGALGVSGIVRPNRPGSHINPSEHQFDCQVCHFEGGFNTNSHFDYNSPADVRFEPSVGVPAGAAVYDPSKRSCSNIICHGGTGSSIGPW